MAKRKTEKLEDDEEMQTESRQVGGKEKQKHTGRETRGENERREEKMMQKDAEGRKRKVGKVVKKKAKRMYGRENGEKNKRKKWIEQEEDLEEWTETGG